MLIKLNEEIIKLCKDFAIESVKTHSYYAQRGQNNVEKIINDIFIGKLGEWASYNFLFKNKIITNKPDMRIYRTGKTHNSDLFNSNYKFSVKTQNLQSAEKFGQSFLKEKDSLDKFLDHKVIICLHINDSLILVQNIISFKTLLDIKSKPKLDKLITKYAFYYNDYLIKNLNF